MMKRTAFLLLAAIWAGSVFGQDGQESVATTEKVEATTVIDLESESAAVTVSPMAAADSIQANNHITHSPWWILAGPVSSGPIKLVTPIVHNEGNMFKLVVDGYDYTRSTPLRVECTGYAYAAGSLIRHSCRAEETDSAVRLVVENRAVEGNVVVLVLGDDQRTWYNPNLSFEYIGWKAKNPADFKWVTGETTPAGTNFNKIFEDDELGRIGIGKVPAVALDVLGDVLATGAATFGGSLTASVVSATGSAVRINDSVGSGNAATSWVGGFDSAGTRRWILGDRTSGNVDIGLTADTGKLWFSAGGVTQQILLDVNGNVGIGTTSPAGRLHIVGNQIISGSGTPYAPAITSSASGGGGHFFEVGNSGLTIFSKDAGILKWGRTVSAPGFGRLIANANGIYLSTSLDDQAYVNRLFVSANGYVGIGNVAPTQALDVTGNFTASGDVTAGGEIAGNRVTAHYQDLAEWVPAASDFPPGTVVVLDTSRRNQVTSSVTAYDTKIAGVVSAQPGLLLGEAADDKVKVATTGRVRVNVDATTRPVAIGDLLVTSDTPGFAMVSVPVEMSGIVIHRPGTIIGKALEPLEEGHGEVLVLLSLQ